MVAWRRGARFKAHRVWWQSKRVGGLVVLEGWTCRGFGHAGGLVVGSDGSDKRSTGEATEMKLAVECKGAWAAYNRRGKFWQAEMV